MAGAAGARIGRLVMRPLSLHPFGATVFYTVFPSPFAREFRAVLAGRRAYAAGHGGHRYLLRRNVHMLEKGLCMQPRRDVFATGYIEETVGALAEVRACDGPFDTDLQWANDVLHSYFTVAGDHPSIARARAAFRPVPLGADPRSTSAGLSPYQRDLHAPPPVSPESLLDLARRRRSVRAFADRPVPRDRIQAAVEIAALSPSACNRQPFQFRVFDDPDQLAEVAAIPMGTKGWGGGIPAFAVIVGDLSAFFSERDRHIIYTDGSLAAMAFVFALETMGIASCCVNWPDIRHREAAMARALDLKPHERPIMCVAIGYPADTGLVPFSQKKPSSDLLRFNNE